MYVNLCKRKKCKGEEVLATVVNRDSKKDHGFE